jgi:hypothetical protein
VSILDTQQAGAVLVNPIFTSVTQATYWTSSVYAPPGTSQAQSWTVELNDGTVKPGIGSAVICVQSPDGGTP